MSLANCLDSSGETMKWESVKREIRQHYPLAVQLSTDELAGMLSGGNAQPPLLLDARTPEEYAVSHLADAILVSSEEDAEHYLQGERPVVIYCSVGYRSSRLAERLTQLGHTNVYNLEGSIFQWANEGRPLFRGQEQVAVVHPYDNHWGQLLYPEFWSFEP